MNYKGKVGDDRGITSHGKDAMAYILIVAWFSTIGMSGATMSGSGHGSGITMQEFDDLKSCQFASVEAQKLAPGIKVVCVPKAIK